jgi:homocysteine S-methyltransferase
LTAEQLQQLIRERILIADGAMGTYLRTFPDRADASEVPELLNLSRPDLIERVHRNYVTAGSDFLLTNSFGASRLRLRSLGREADFETINRAAVALARNAAESASRKVRVAGSIGPLGSVRFPADVIRLDRIAAEYEKQTRLLADAGVDFFVLETMDDFREALAALRAARKTGLAAVAQFTTADGETLNGRIDLYNAIRRMEAEGAAAVGVNCRIGPTAMLDAARRLARFASRPLSVQPNAGNLDVDAYGRMRVVGDADEFAALAKASPELGIGIIGGCCYTTPEHIAVLKESLRSGATFAKPEIRERETTGPRPPTGFEEKLEAGQFVVCVEIDPPTNEEVESDPGILSYKIDGARYLAQEAKADALTVADHTMGRPWLDGFPFAEAIKPHLGAETDILLHYTCRNKAETDVNGNFASFKLYGYRNILIITGDRPPVDKSFYAYSSPQLIERIASEHNGHFFLACSFDHNRGREREGSAGIDMEIKRLRRKIDAGAKVALTQPIYEVERVRLLREKTRDLPIRILPGVMPILSASHARTVNQFPGIHVPDAVIERMEAAGEDREEKARISVEIASEVARAIQTEGFPGIYLITPLNRFDVIRHVIGELKR